MSSPDNQPVEQSSEQVSAGEQDPEAVLGDLVLETESHTNAPGFVIRPDDVVSALSRLKNVAGYDHLSNVTAQEYQDRFESIYHLKKYDDPTDEVHLIVPTTAENPSSQSGNAVFRTADWHEREAYDLFGIEYEDHPDLKRILMPETWQGHPMRDDYDQNRPQVVAFREHENPLASQDEDGDTMFLNVGPHHPATHGVLHLKTVLEGEQVRDVESDIGYLHRCEEQLCEDSSYRYEIMPYPDRWDYISAGLLNEWAYARTAEDLADLDVPDYAQVLRTMGAELCRISSHLFALATFALDVNGDFTAAFMYALKEREKSQDILEALTGQRLMFNYFRLGGVAWDIPEPRGEFFEETRTFIGDLPDAIDEFHALITNNEILQIRTIDVGVLEPDVAKSYGCTGPVARGSGIDYDLRRDDPYGWYDELDWDVITEDGCDNYSRLLVRMKEVEESAKIVDQCIDLLEDWPEDERDIQSNVPRTVSPDPDREVYRAVEAAKGELGIYIRTDGTDKPGRYKIRSPCFSNLQALPEMAKGDYLPDLIATLGSLDIVLGEVDR